MAMVDFKIDFKYLLVFFPFRKFPPSVFEKRRKKIRPPYAPLFPHKGQTNMFRWHNQCFQDDRTRYRFNNVLQPNCDFDLERTNQGRVTHVRRE